MRHTSDNARDRTVCSFLDQRCSAQGSPTSAHFEVYAGLLLFGFF